MMNADNGRVLSLVRAASEGMMTVAEDTSAADVLSAHLTMTLPAIECILSHSMSPTDRELNRAAIMDGLMKLFKAAEGGDCGHS